MAGRMFLNVVAQFKETTDTRIGVIDSEGTVIACTDLQEIGKKWPQLVQPINDAGDGCVTLEAEAEEGADLRRTLSGCAAEQGWPLLELTASELSLEHIFLQLTGGTGEPEGSGSAGPDSGLPAAAGIGEGGRV